MCPSLIAPDTPFTRSPTLGEMKSFLIWLARSVKGQLGKRASITSIDTYWKRLERLIKLHRGYRYPEEDRKEVRQVR